MIVGGRGPRWVEPLGECRRLSWGSALGVTLIMVDNYALEVHIGHCKREFVRLKQVVQP